MTQQTRSAERQAEALIDGFLTKRRYIAALKLRAAIRDAAQQIELSPMGGLPYPRPYPKIARWGFRWIKVHRYWIGWSMTKGYPCVTNVHYETSRIVRRVVGDEADDVPI
jgi:hypothetical protein